MKITEIETLAVGAPTPGNGRLTDRNYLFVRVHTDEGLVGLGEATLEGHDFAVQGMIRDVEPLLLGEDPRRIEYLVQILTRQTFWLGGAVKGSAIAGIELALWDILGRSVGLPVYQLVGGAVRDRIRYYVNGWTGGATDPHEIGEAATAAVEAGHTALKFSLALPTWPIADRDLVIRLAAVLQEIRDAAGDVLLMYDGHGRYYADLAIQVARVLASFDCYFFEEPVHPRRLGDMRRVAAAGALPLAAGERLTTKEEYVGHFEDDTLAIAQPDLAHCHGFAEGLRIAALADTFGVGIAPHGPMSPVLTTISMHLDAVVPNFVIQERLQLNSWGDSVITTPLVMVDGHLPLPTGPGWGIDLDLEVCRAHPPFQVTQPRLFRPDGSPADW